MVNPTQSERTTVTPDYARMNFWRFAHEKWPLRDNHENYTDRKQNRKINRSPIWLLLIFRFCFRLVYFSWLTLKLSGSIWREHSSFLDNWQYLAISSDKWLLLAINGGKWREMVEINRHLSRLFSQFIANYLQLLPFGG